MINIIIPVTLNSRTCEINLWRTLFSNDEDKISVVWYEDGESIETWDYKDLTSDLKTQVDYFIEEFDKKQVIKNL